MKRKIFIVLLVLLLGAGVYAAMTNSASSILTNTTYITSQSQYLNPVYKMLNEVEGILEGSSTFPGNPLLGDNVALYFGTGSDFYGRWDGTNFDWLAAADDSAINYNGGTYRMDWWIWSDADANRKVGFDASADTNSGSWSFGSDANGVDAVFYTRTAGDNATWDASGKTLTFTDSSLVMGDGDSIYFGADSDVSAVFDGSNFIIQSATADEGFQIGGTTTGFDVTYYFETAGQFRTDYDGDFINLTDDMELRFGTGASSDGDLKVSSNSSNVLQVEQVVSGTGTIEIGVDDKGIDTKFYAEVAGDYMQWDQDGSTNGALVFEDSSIHMMDDTTIILGDGSDATIEYDEDGTDELRVTGNTIVNGLLSNRVRTEVVDANDTLTAAQSGYWLFYTAGSTVSLPEATGSGAIYYIVDANATAAADLTIDPNASCSINGDTAGEYVRNETDADGCMAILVDAAANTWYAIFTPSAWTEE